ncbi:BCAS2 family protein [Cordyceps fumosorosea ARSEF 2679]|uniref:BCAS2 family protein n=1 Tax=Cordyceps fumosorosea (strain ARSEF 2679) TaxID=1081104 RepID=A0A167SCA3_CORFA|nr:BCAS2 family protein [Cordyceps fumosorosea ARSEF 2679]OAA59480.1 BCAS2 family protein [Cordyceps fumosorosea ARSEF 2679]
MSIPAYHESLPYIDEEPSVEVLAAARALIDAEIASSSSSSSSASPPSHPPPSFTSTMTIELDRVASQTPLQPLDLSRYEAQDPLPTSSAPAASLRGPLERAQVSAAYLAARNQNLRLLDRGGRNAWLLVNYHAETELRTLEAELAAARREVDLVNAARRARQDEVAAEMRGLEEGWRARVGRVLETEIAVEELRQQIRDELRNQNPPRE